MENTLNLNLDAKTLEACLKTINNIGSTTYQNICTGAMTTVPWGMGTWLENGFTVLLFSILALMIVGVMLMIFSSTRY